MSRTILISILALFIFSTSAQANGTRNWLVINTPYAKEKRPFVPHSGYNYHANKRRTNVVTDQDATGWMNIGNLRNNNSASIYHWRRHPRAR